MKTPTRLFVFVLLALFSRLRVAEATAIPFEVFTYDVFSNGQADDWVRTWTDFNRNSIPDCDLINLGKNGECGAVANIQAASFVTVADPGPGGALITTLSAPSPNLEVETKGDVLISGAAGPHVYVPSAGQPGYAIPGSGANPNLYAAMDYIIWTDGSNVTVRFNGNDLLMPYYSDGAAPSTNYANTASFSAPTSIAPEPASLLLFGTGLFGVGARRWRTRRQRS